jgi:hypothetical protein
MIDMMLSKAIRTTIPLKYYEMIDRLKQRHGFVRMNEVICFALDNLYYNFIELNPESKDVLSMLQRKLKISKSTIVNTAIITFAYMCCKEGEVNETPCAFDIIGGDK